MNFSQKKAIAWLTWIAWLWISGVPSIAQNGSVRTQIDHRFFEAVQDSAIKYELIKPRLFSLQKSYEQLAKEKLASQNEQRFLSFQHQAQIQKFELQLADQPKKNKRWFVAGFVGGLIIGAIIK
ncbi:hypothetical protein [Dyadobacter sp. CY323]|uniref:hypothetical protein n=1 Tax=Dyadobacter sp. CY323 TaxID=2907302 RepID=UPI001F29F2F9|nr:hypothetical protein [Dyadobacter sp. CY323]MCE6987499.1 hypothetical protein [Dyadobacter sp. CY323]